MCRKGNGILSAKANAVLAIVVVSVLLGVGMMIPRVYSATEVYVTPPSNSYTTDATSAGFKFNVTIYVKDVSNLFAYQARMYYDSTMINATSAWLPIWDPEWVFYGKASVKPSVVIYGNYVQIGDSLLSGATFYGTGKLGIVEFQILRAPTKMQTLSCILAIDNEDTFLLDYGLEVIPSLQTSGSYSYAWSPPSTKPYLAVNPTYTRQTTNGSSFYIEIFLERLDSAWELTNATISLDFNGTIVDVLGGSANVTVFSNWSGPNDVNVVHGSSGRLSLVVRNPTVAVGNLSVAQVRFTIIGSGISNLTFVDYRLCDHVIEIPTDPPVNGRVNTLKLVSDISILDVKSSKTVVGKGYSAFIDVTVANEGDAPETFEVSVYAGMTVVRTETISLSNQTTATFPFRWDTAGFEKGNYTISAYATPLPGETHLEDNTFVDGILTVAIIGDISGPVSNAPDGKVDIRDIATVALAFGSYSGHLRWNPNADLSGPLTGVPDGKVDIRDIAAIAIQFGKIDP